MMYPMPDNMGFQRASITDMLPDEIAEMDRQAIRKHMQSEHMGLQEWTCAECGKKFSAYAEHKYKRSGSGRKMARYCSYNCYRKLERLKEEKRRKKMLDALAEAEEEKKPKTKLERAQERLAYWQALEASAEFREYLPCRQKEIRANIARWTVRVMTEEARAGEAGQSV